MHRLNNVCVMHKGTVTDTSLAHRHVYTTYTINPLPCITIINVPFAGSQKNRGSQWPSISYSLLCQKVTIQHVLSISTFCIRIYRPQWRLSSFKLLCNLFGTTLDCTNGIIWAIFSCHILISFSISLFLEILGDNAVKIVTVGNCYIY